MDNVTHLTHGWTLIDDGIIKMTGAHSYRLVPPKWSVTFWVSDDLEWVLDADLDRAGEMLVAEILKDSRVKEEVDRRVRNARHDGYFGAYDEIHSGKRFEL